MLIAISPEVLGGVEMLLYMLGISKKLVHGTLLAAGCLPPPTMGADICNPGGCLIQTCNTCSNFVAIYHALFYSNPLILDLVFLTFLLDQISLFLNHYLLYLILLDFM